jgi:predicted cupin superfamily sugar epimerase
MLTLDQIKTTLKLQPHPKEGGFFAETYRCATEITTPSGRRSLHTAIYYLLTPESFSEMHRLPDDEMFHFYLGDPVETLQLHPDGTSDIINLGQDILHGMRLQHVVSGDVWQGSRLKAGGRYALLGTTMSPGFAYEDYLSGEAAALAAKWPDRADMIRELTRL